MPRASRSFLVGIMAWAAMTVAGRSQARRLQTFTVYEVSGHRQAGRVVTAGLWLRRGLVADGEPLVVRAAGRSWPAQVRTLGRWPDGSCHRVAVTFPVWLSPHGRKSAVLLSHASRGGGPPSKLRAFETAEGGVAVHTGRIAFEVPPDAAVALVALRREDGGRGVVVRRATAGEGGGEARLVIEDLGPHRAVILQEGAVQAPGSTRDLAVERRITARAGDDSVDVETWFRNDAHFGAFPAIDLVLELASPPVALRTPWARTAIAREARPACIRQPRVGHPALQLGQGAPLRDERLTAGAVTFETRRHAVSVSVRDFVHLGPAHITVDEPGLLRVGLVSERYPWTSGVRPGRAVRIRLPRSRGKRSVATPFADPVVLPRAPSVPAFARLATDADADGWRGIGSDLRTKILAELDDPEAARRHGWDWRGEAHAGDWRWSRSDAGNLEYDTLWGLAAWSVSAGRPDLWRRCERGTRHLLQRDLDLHRTGLPLMHGPWHRSRRVELGHVWLQGLLVSSTILADPFVLEATGALLDAWRAHVDATDLAILNTRSIAWALLSGSTLYAHTRRKDDLARLTRLARAVTAAPGGNVPLFERLSEEEGLHYVAPWVVAGILGEAVHTSLAHRKDPTLRHRMAAAIHEMADLAWEPREPVLRARLIYASDTGRCVNVGGESTGEEALFFALGLRRAVALGADASLNATAVQVARWALDHLRLEQKIYRGMEISQLLWIYSRLLGPGS